MNSKTISNILLFIFVLLATLLLVEVAMNSLVKPSAGSSGVFRGTQLPPMNVFPADLEVKTAEQRAAFLNEWFDFMVVDSKKITRGDLWGIFRQDPLPGYVPEENAVSANGWWQSNNLGARSRQDILMDRLPGRKRLLFFGDSFTQGSRVSQEQTFQHYMNSKAADIEAINFGVDGYGMGQSYLRYTMLKDELEYDHVFLVFVPETDLWRDINVSRYIGDNWNSYMVYPRFVIENDQISLVSSPYPDLQTLVNENRESVKPELKQYLEKYEAFYFKSGYQSSPLLDWSVMYRLYRARQFNKDRSRLLSGLGKPGSEAMQVSKRIFQAMDRDARERGSRYSLVLLPLRREIGSYSRSDSFKRRWQEMVAFFCSDKIHCIDLMGRFQEIPFEKLDRGYDGTHYGPVVNSLIADFILESITSPASLH